MKKILLLIPIIFFACNSQVEIKQQSTKAQSQGAVPYRRIYVGADNWVVKMYRYTSKGMEFELTVATTGASYGAIVINTTNLTKDSLECEYYKKRISDYK